MEHDKHETITCPRCRRPFVCKANRVHRCDCMSVDLSQETLEDIRQRYEGCLCLACLKELQAGAGEGA